MFLLCCAFIQAGEQNKQSTSDILGDEIGLMSNGDLSGQDHVTALLYKHLPKGGVLTLHYLKTQLYMFKNEQKGRLLPLLSLRSRNQKKVKAQLILRLIEDLKRLLQQSNVAA